MEDAGAAASSGKAGGARASAAVVLVLWAVGGGGRRRRTKRSNEFNAEQCFRYTNISGLLRAAGEEGGFMLPLHRLNCEGVWGLMRGEGSGPVVMGWHRGFGEIIN